MSQPADTRIDPSLGTTVHVVGSRQARPNLPSAGCPFCPGGLEAPEPYEVRWFPNRWPAMEGERCEVVLYSDDHDATFASLGVRRARQVIDLWAERTEALSARDDVGFVLCFENRGPEVGATIAHPHGQIYAYDHIPERPLRLLQAGWTPDLASLDDAGRDGLAEMLIDIATRLDRLYDRPLPYMLWVNQRPADGNEWPQAWCNIEIVSPWRAAGVARFIAAAEVACGEYFNPVVPEALAERLRLLG